MQLIKSRSISSSPSPGFERYIKEARGVLRIGDEQMLETNSLTRVALTLMAKEMEKDKELSVLRLAMEKDKELSVLRLAMEKDKELSVLEKDKELSVLEKEKDKELSVLRLGMEKDKEIALLTRTYLERDEYRKSQLMHVT